MFVDVQTTGLLALLPEFSCFFLCEQMVFLFISCQVFAVTMTEHLLCAGPASAYLECLFLYSGLFLKLGLKMRGK